MTAILEPEQIHSLLDWTTVPDSKADVESVSDELATTRGHYPSSYPRTVVGTQATVLLDTTYLIEQHDRFIVLPDHGRSARRLYQSYKKRIEDLRSDAALDGFNINEASEREFWSFVYELPVFRVGDLVLADNGNLHVEWEGELDAHLGLQFLGNGMIQYVIFRHRPHSKRISRVAGRDNLDGVKRQIRNFDLETLLEVV